VPVGVHPDGFDPVWWPRSFARGVNGGAPPDAFAPGGQDWGFPPLHPIGIREDRYAYVIAMLRHAFAHADVVRLDHVMGLHRLYWVPEHLDARHGAYVRYPFEELRALVAIEAARAQVAVVGEDLGTVPPEVRAGMATDRMLRSFVMQFDVSAEDPLPTPPEESMASWGTHDLVRFAAFAAGSDLDERAGEPGADLEAIAEQRRDRAEWRTALERRCAPEAGPAGPAGETESAGEARETGSAGEPGTRELLSCCLEHLASSPARLVSVDLEDLWLETEPQNRPGTGVEGANWCRRAAYSLEEIEDDPSIAALLGRIDTLRQIDTLRCIDGHRPPDGLRHEEATCP
jgi:4-alpha-glucanotransferase